MFKQLIEQQAKTRECLNKIRMCVGDIDEDDLLRRSRDMATTSLTHSSLDYLRLWGRMAAAGEPLPFSISRRF